MSKKTELKAAAARVAHLAAARKKRTATSATAKRSSTKKRVAAKKAAAALDTAPNGGFEGSPLTRALDNVNLGEEDFGLSIPPELAKAIEEGKADDPKNESYQPGVLIPPGLEDAVMAVADIEDFDEDEEVEFDLVPFGDTKAETADEIMEAGAHWVLFANGDPVAKISLKDQDHSKKIAAHFVSNDFPRMVINGIGKHGIRATLKDLKAKPYVAKIDENKKIKQIRAALSAKSEETLRQKVASVKANYISNLGLVLEASANNFIVENPLKDAFISAFRSVNIPEATAAEMADAAFFQHGVKTIAGLLNKAEDWSNLTADALSEIKNAMRAAGKRSFPLPSDRSHADANPDYDHDLAASMAAGGVPVHAMRSPTFNVASTSAASPEKVNQSAKDAFRKKHGRFNSF